MIVAIALLILGIVAWRRRAAIAHAVRLGVRIATVAIVAGGAGLIATGVHYLATGHEGGALTVVGSMVVAGLATGWATRGWTRAIAARPAASSGPTLIAPAQRARLAAVTAGLIAAPDNLAAAEWLEVCRRRVPELDAAARAVAVSADGAGQRAVARDLAADIDAIIREGERRAGLDPAGAADRWATMRRYVRARTGREG